jgi:hypothetical protein
MTTWTKMKINKMLEFSTNAWKTTVTVKSIYGEYTDSVSNIRRKLQDADLLPPVRKMFQDMLDYWEKIK